MKKNPVLTLNIGMLLFNLDGSQVAHNNNKTIKIFIKKTFKMFNEPHVSEAFYIFECTVL